MIIGSICLLYSLAIVQFIIDRANITLRKTECWNYIVTNYKYCMSLKLEKLRNQIKKKKNEWLIIQDTKAKVVLMYYNDEWVE